MSFDREQTIEQAMRTAYELHPMRNSINYVTGETWTFDESVYRHGTVLLRDDIEAAFPVIVRAVLDEIWSIVDKYIDIDSNEVEPPEDCWRFGRDIKALMNGIYESLGN